MQFSLTGLSQDADVRTYAFDGNAPGQQRRNITVSVDIALARRYAISLQELPLLCLRFLEAQSGTDEPITLTFSEQEMRSIADRREEAKRLVAMNRKPPRRPRPGIAEPNDQQ